MVDIWAGRFRLAHGLPRSIQSCCKMGGGVLLAVQVTLNGYIDPIKLFIPFAATMTPAAKRRSDATTIPIPRNLSRRTVLRSASFGCAIEAIWIRKATTLALAANITPTPKHTKASLKITKFPVKPFFAGQWQDCPEMRARRRQPLHLEKELIGWMPVHSWRGHQHTGETIVLLQYLELN